MKAEKAADWPTFELSRLSAEFPILSPEFSNELHLVIRLGVKN